MRLVKKCHISIAYWHSFAHMQSNPVLDPWTDNSYGAPPFQSVTAEHILPALRKCIQDATAALNEICSNIKEEPTFANTVIPYETDSRLTKLRHVRSFFISVVNTVEEFRSVKAPGYELLQQFDRHPCQSMILGRLAKVDIRHLSAEDKRLVRVVTEGFKSRGITLKDDPQSVSASSLKIELTSLRSAYAQAIKHHMAGAAEFVLSNPSIADAQLLSAYDALETQPSDDSLSFSHEKKDKAVCRYRVPNHPDAVDRVLSNCSDRSVREIVWTNFRNRGKPANYGTAQRMLIARSKFANITGFQNHAQFSMRHSMVSDAAEVLKLCGTLLEPAKRAFQREMSQLLEVSAGDGIIDSRDFMPWDYKYYYDKLRKGDPSLASFEELPTFKLAEVMNGLTWLVQELYGDNMAPAPDAPRYHQHVLPYSLKSSSGALLGLMYVDVWTRPGKSPGNWTQHIIRASSATGGRHVVSLNCNFEHLIGDPDGLNFDHVRLLLREFGHCLHCLYSDVKYASLSGMTTPDDHVDLPSTLHERFLHDPRFLCRLTTAKLPVGICSKLMANFCKNIGYTMLRAVSSSILDLRLHTLPLHVLETLNVEDFELKLHGELGMPPQIPYLYESSSFDHVFCLDYRYYLYVQQTCSSLVLRSFFLEISNHLISGTCGLLFWFRPHFLYF
jgi:peptidyl-dipeptidase Dcp